MMFLRSFNHANMKAQLMGAMIDRLGVDLVAAAGRGLNLELERAVRTCRFCSQTDLCRAWLSGATRVDRHTFCPNADTFDAMPQQAPPSS